MAVRGVVFDFDGLILDTETPEFESWAGVFASHGATLEPGEWAKCVGGGEVPWKVEDHLAELVPGIDVRAAEAEARRIRDARLLEISPRPGVFEILSLLDDMQIPFAIASSSRHLWVDGHLQNHGLRDRFPIIWTADRVGAKKPDPKVYLAAVAELGTNPAETLAFEDSTNGLLAAKRAGMAAVAIPNPVTASFDLSLADCRLESLLQADRRFFEQFA